jgi:hypothetical protein
MDPRMKKIGFPSFRHATAINSHLPGVPALHHRDIATDACQFLYDCKAATSGSSRNPAIISNRRPFTE